MQLAISELHPRSRVWIFGASELLDESRQAVILNRMRAFLQRWAAHGTDLPAAVEIVDQRFVIVAADTSASASGCSIDTLFRALGELETELGLQLLDSSRVFFRDGQGAAHGVTRPEFRELVQSGRVTPDTVVFDTNAEALEEITSGAWQRPFSSSWHAQAFSSR